MDDVYVGVSDQFDASLLRPWHQQQLGDSLANPDRIAKLLSCQEWIFALVVSDRLRALSKGHHQEPGRKHGGNRHIVDFQVELHRVWARSAFRRDDCWWDQRGDNCNPHRRHSYKRTGVVFKTPRNWLLIKTLLRKLWIPAVCLGLKRGCSERTESRWSWSTPFLASQRSSPSGFTRRYLTSFCQKF